MGIGSLFFQGRPNSGQNPFQRKRPAFGGLGFATLKGHGFRRSFGAELHSLLIMHEKVTERKRMESLGQDRIERITLEGNATKNRLAWRVLRVCSCIWFTPSSVRVPGGDGQDWLWRYRYHLPYVKPNKSVYRPPIAFC